jgi:alkaline phosphatase D
MASHESGSSFTRRGFLATSATTALVLPQVESAAAIVVDRECRQATGARVGEITPSSAIVWARLTKHSVRNNGGVVFEGKGNRQKPAVVDMDVAEIEGACPGAKGQIRLLYHPHADRTKAIQSPWRDVSEDTDFATHFSLSELEPATEYHYSIETREAEQSQENLPLSGKFVTAPRVTSPSELRFCVMTCQGYPDRGHPDGHDIYPAMQALNPAFVVLTGDVVYYDNDPPQAVNAELARLHWERMFSLPRQRKLLLSCGTYWLKDDHDTLKNDSWPGAKAGKLTFAEGQKIFQQQTPLMGKGYRTFRWGRDLQIWLTDGRDNRSPNNSPDGPSKTIWGEEQKEWFKSTMKASDATWRVLISPTPLVGPDREGKNDNHANRGFSHEGNELRDWLQVNAPDNFLVLCGDRHWQYHSVHPETGLHEFSVGPASNEHAGGTPGHNPKYHRFHRVKGGFASVSCSRSGDKSRLRVIHHDVHGQAVYEWQQERDVAT